MDLLTRSIKSLLSIILVLFDIEQSLLLYACFTKSIPVRACGVVANCFNAAVHSASFLQIAQDIGIRR